MPLIITCLRAPSTSAQLLSPLKVRRNPPDHRAVEPHLHLPAGVLTPPERMLAGGMSAQGPSPDGSLSQAALARDHRPGGLEQLRDTLSRLWRPNAPDPGAGGAALPLEAPGGRSWWWPPVFGVLGSEPPLSSLRLYLHVALSLGLESPSPCSPMAPVLGLGVHPQSRITSSQDL